MKLLACTALMIGVLSQHAIAAKVEWRGSLCITAIAAACPAGDWEIACYNIRYRPPNLGDNGPPTHLSFGSGEFRYGLDLSSGTLIGTTYQPVNQTTVTAFGFTANPSMRLTTHKPAILTTTTKSVEIGGNIKDIDGGVGCNLTFRGAGVLLP